jgi:hypothetical protein
MRTGIAGDGDVLDVGRLELRGIQAVPDRQCRKPRLVFEACKAFFLDCRYELSIAEQGGRNIAVIRIAAEYVRGQSLLP